MIVINDQDCGFFSESVQIENDGCKRRLTGCSEDRGCWAKQVGQAFADLASVFPLERSRHADNYIEWILTGMFENLGLEFVSRGFSLARVGATIGCSNRWA